MTTALEALRQAIPALELGLDALSAEAAAYHEAMKGYRLLEHAQRDADVAAAQKALDTARAVIAAQPEAPDTSCNRGNRCPWSDGDPSVCAYCGRIAAGSGQ